MGAPDVEILADHLFEETASSARMIHDLGQRKLCLTRVLTERATATPVPTIVNDYRASCTTSIWNWGQTFTSVWL
jgi:hypothetical protein